MPDSQTLISFKNFASNSNWDEAFKYCNGLDLPEMLLGLDSLRIEGLLAMKQRAPSYQGRYGWERIAFAIEVTASSSIGTFPGMTPNDRSDASQFVGRRAAAKASSASTASAAAAVKAALATGMIRDPKRELTPVINNGYADIAGKRCYLAKEMVLLLAALAEGKSQISILSLLRPGQGPHGIAIADTEYFCQAVDIGQFGTVINVTTTRDNTAYLNPEAPFLTHAAVLGVLSRLPRLSGLLYGIGSPRATYQPLGPDAPEPLRLYLPDPANPGAAKGVNSLKDSFTYNGRSIAVRSEIALAIARSPSGRVAWFNGDGIDHIHVQVERRNAPRDVYRAAIYKP